jgi:hypothetical protein
LTGRTSFGIILTFCLVAIFAASPLSAAENRLEGCTVIGVGRLASADGSVMTSHTDC